MNRIYQGRVTRIEAKKEDGTFEQVAFGKDQSNCPLWRHHEIFQDAVNYYLMALAALAGEQITGADRLMTDLPKRIADSWEKFPKPDAARAGARSLRDSVAPWLGLDGSATIDQAYAAILDGNRIDKKALSYALALVLDECSGDSGIQQGGREYLPKLCDSDSKATYNFSASSVASGEGKGRLAVTLHGGGSQDDLEKIALEMDLSWVVKVSPGEFYEGAEAITRLNQAIDHLVQMVANPSERLAAALADIADVSAQINELRGAVKLLPEGYRIARNRKAAPDLTFSTIVFMAFPSRLTAAFLKLGIKAPAKSETSAKKNDAIDFAALGDDPVKLARGSRGYVFKAFTALSRWNPLNPGKPVWKEFDIAAFKEALKALNQFRLKTDEREEKKKDLEGLIAYLIGSPIKKWKPSKGESGEETELPEPLEPELLKLAWELEEEMTQGLSESVVGEMKQLSFGDGSFPIREGGWTVTRASLRGLRDIIDVWRKLIAQQGADIPTSELEQAVKEYQGKEGKSAVIGSVSLFLTLCEPRFRPLWMDSDPEEEEAGEDNRFLHRLADLHESVADYLKCDEAINLTPAEPRYSRRLFMFSDMNGKSAPKYLGVDCLEVSIATEGDDAQQQRYRLRFGAPRLRRDGLLGKEDGWLQPVTKALGLKLSKPDPAPFDSAVSLMPDFDASSSLRFLLNFAADVDAEPIRTALGKAALWDRQFNGTKEKNIHLHWPGTVVDPSKMKTAPWWENHAIIEKGFTVMATDLGQRTAGSWALLKIKATRPETPRPVRSIGHDGTREWFAEISKTGMLRLPGEDAWIRGKDGHMAQELSGKAGRMASKEEWKQSLELAKALLAEEPENWIGAECSEKSYPEQNDALLKLANRRLSRLQTFHRWSCFDPEKESDSARKDSLIKKLIAELDQWEDEDVSRWALKVEAGDYDGFRAAAGTAFASYRAGLLPHLVTLANRVAPLREDRWEWRQRGGESPYGDLVRNPREHGTKPPVRGQRGLSLSRIEQMENLRRLFLRYNRSLDREAGKPAKFGRADAGRDSGEPCRDLLEKIDRIKEQRVDQTAHLILAQALGVKLAPHSLSAQARQEGDHHGEYTRIPGREPVDLVVIEDLGRYLSSQGRAPSENSRLMKWAHRAVRDKVKMLIEEPFGIPVLEVPAAYSSRFCAVTGEAGARCEERAELDDYLREILERRSVTPAASGQHDLREANLRLLMQFKLLDAINARRRASEKAPRTLLLQKTGGPLFVGAGKKSSLVQSDMNAAINLAFRAVAAPEALHLLHRIRSEKTGDQITTMAKNKREIAGFGKKGLLISMEGEPSAKLSKSANFFHDPAGIAKFDRGEIEVEGKAIPVASGIGLWHAVNGAILPKIVAINEDRLRRYGLAEAGMHSEKAEDNIPM
jgi:hypothetical protein